MFYAIEGDTGCNRRHKTLADVTKAAQRKCISRTGEEVVILQAYAVAEIPVTGVTITPIVDVAKE